MSKTSVSKGHIIDQFCQYQDGTLVDNNKDVYSCTLNQVIIKTNANKYYVIQLISHNNIYYLYTRYGRQGESGKTGYKTFPTQSAGMKAFEKQFRSKTKNKWSDKANFKKFPKKYCLMEIDYEDEFKDVDDSPKNVPESKLEAKVQDLIAMFSDINMMKNTLIQLDIDTKKMPLGKLKASQIDKAMDLIDQIQDKLVHLNGTTSDDIIEELNEEICELSSLYYTFIPFCCARRRPPIIKNKEMIGKYRQTLEDLKNIVITTKIMESVSGKRIFTVSN